MPTHTRVISTSIVHDILVTHSIYVTATGEPINNDILVETQSIKPEADDYTPRFETQSFTRG